jgi:plasmid stabilization system protein ParE
VKSYRFLEEAEAELHEAVAYCDRQTPALGDRFINEIEHSIRRVLEFPPNYWRKRIGTKNRRSR